MTNVTPDQLQAICREWQSLLRLMDWDVTITFVRASKLGTFVGRSLVSDSWGQVKIEIVEPEDYPTSEWGKQDIERDVVHELLHIHLNALDTKPDTLEHTSKELAIDRIATTLVNLKRQIPVTSEV